MIIKVWSDLPNFQTVQFEPGMNLVLADRTNDSDETDSTNGLGKTTLLRIIHFCLGSDLSKDRVLKHPKLKGASFGIDFTFDGEVVTARRNTESHERVSVSSNFVVGTPSAKFVTNAKASISLEDWKSLLTLRFAPTFADQRHVVSFREIAHYLIRLGKAASADPLTAFHGQPGPSKRLTVSYLLGLNWSSQKTLHELLEARSQVDAAIKALKTAESSVDQRSIGDMEAERVALEDALAAKRVQVESFNVRDDYKDLESSLGSVDRDLHELINENHADRRLLEHYRKSAAELPEADQSKPLSILRDAGAIFREEALKKLEDVAAFHSEVHRNRSEFLKGEIRRLNATIRHRSDTIEGLTTEKSRLLKVLQTSGALEQLIELQRSYTDQSVQLESLKIQITERKRYDVRKDDLTADIAHERAVMKRDMSDRQPTIDEARKLFAEYTQYLYGKPGALSIDVNSGGYNFSFSIDRSGSDGVDQMVVFCFDLTVATLRARRESGFCTLVHDSSLFADVDPRQYGLALQLAAARSESEGFQYICCLNSGALPVGHLGDLDLDAITRLTLTDEGEEGTLLGMRLPPVEPKKKS